MLTHLPAPRRAVAPVPYPRPRRGAHRAPARAAAPPRVRCPGRTDDMLIVRGVNVFPSAVRDVVGSFALEVSGHVVLRPASAGVKLGAAAAGQRRAGARPRAGRRPRRGDPRETTQRARGGHPRRAGAVGQPRAQRVQVDARPTLRGAECGRSRARASTTSRSSARIAGRRSISGRACSACRSSSSSRTSTTRRRATSTSTPATAGSSRCSRTRSAPRTPRGSRRPRKRPPRRVRALAGDVPPHRGAAGRAGHPPLGRQRPWLHGLDLLRRPARPPHRARVVSVRAAVRLHARGRAPRGAQAARRARRLQHRPGPPHRRDRAARHAVATLAVRGSLSPNDPYS